MTADAPPLPDWIYQQSAALPYRWQDDELQVLLVTSRRGTRWIIPKGIVEPGLTPQASAAKEAYEEAGVEGDIAVTPIGSYRREKWGGTCDVHVYPLRVTNQLDEWSEAGSRRRRWSSVPDAMDDVEEDGLRQVIAELPRIAAAPDRFAGELHAPEGPTRLIYVLRHAEAVPAAGSATDFDRPLNEAGLRALYRMLRYLSMADVDPQIVLCSPAVRATQTLEAVAPVFETTPAVQYNRVLYESGVDSIVEELRVLDRDVRRVMVVGHNPTLYSLVERLGDRGPNRQPLTGFPPGSIAILQFGGPSWMQLGGGSCVVHSVVAPSDLGDTTRF